MFAMSSETKRQREQEKHVRNTRLFSVPLWICGCLEKEHWCIQAKYAGNSDFQEPLIFDGRRFFAAQV